jgi:hypothetical protein
LIENRKTDKEITPVVDVQQSLDSISPGISSGDDPYGATFLVTAH